MFSFGAESRACMCVACVCVWAAVLLLHGSVRHLTQCMTYCRGYRFTHIRFIFRWIQNEMKKKRINLQCGFPVRSHLCCRQSRHYTLNLHTQKATDWNEMSKVEKKSNTFCPYLIILHRTPHSTRSTCCSALRVSVCLYALLFLFAQIRSPVARFCCSRRFDSIRSVPSYYLTRFICLFFSSSFFFVYFHSANVCHDVVTWNKFLIPITFWYPQWIELNFFEFFSPCGSLYPFTTPMYRFFFAI